MDRNMFEKVATFNVSIFLFLAGSGELCRCIGLVGGSTNVILG